MSTYAIKPPDMSRNIALAGKTVSSRGMNVTYDELGYAVSATNYGHKIFAGTEKGVRAPSKEAVLASAERGGDTLTAEDRTHFSDRELAHAADLQQQAADGKLSQQKANEYINEIRKMYGYTGGSGGEAYAKLEYPATQDELPETVARGASVQAAASQESETDRLQSSYQEQLKQQQQRQSLQSELNDLRTDALLKSYGEQKKNELFDVLFEDEEDK